MTDEELETLIAERDLYRAALECIRSTYGQVCDEYEVCKHKACYGSYGAWATADAVLRLAPPTAREPVQGLDHEQ